jgi:SAM-dependent methyltransferase
MKKLISWVIRKVPRKYLQVLSPAVLKVLGLFYRGNTVTCPISGKSYRKFLPYGRINPRPNALCPDSLSLERHRLIWLFLQRRTDFFERQLHFLHIAPEQCFIKKFEAQHADRYITADIESPLAKVKMDIHQIPFADNTFDAAMCNHVMEHVKDDFKAMSEIYRVLKPGGWAIVQIPLFYPLPEHTLENPEITDPNERLRVFGQEDHVRMYGKDYAQRLRSVGFDVVEDDFVKTLSADEVARYALPADEPIFFCRKTT